MSDSSMMFEVPLKRLHELQEAEEQILAVYQWLVEELGFPLEMSTNAKPSWLDTKRLARRWNESDNWGVTEDEAVAIIYYETGWDENDE